VLALTVTLCVKTGVAVARLRPIPIKKHGRRAWSLFALGVATLRKIAASARPAEVIAFLRQLLSPKLPVNQLKSMAVRKGVEYDALGFQIGEQGFDGPSLAIGGKRMARLGPIPRGIAFEICVSDLGRFARNGFYRVANESRVGRLFWRISSLAGMGWTIRARETPRFTTSMRYWR